MSAWGPFPGRTGRFPPLSPLLVLSARLLSDFDPSLVLALADVLAQSCLWHLSGMGMGLAVALVFPFFYFGVVVPPVAPSPVCRVCRVCRVCPFPPLAPEGRLTQTHARSTPRPLLDQVSFLGSSRDRQLDTMETDSRLQRRTRSELRASGQSHQHATATDS